MSCLFCKIIAGEIPSTKVYENDLVYAFKDINPVAKVHVVIVPKRHIETLNDATGDDLHDLGAIQLAAAQIAREMGIAEGGYRLVNNCNEHGGQTVFHIHYHLIGGSPMGWPPFPQ